MIRDKWVENCGKRIIFSNFKGILFGPIDLLVLNHYVISDISCEIAGDVKKENGSLLLRQSKGDFWDLGKFFLTPSATFTKKLLKLFVISIELVTGLPFLSFNLLTTFTWEHFMFLYDIIPFHNSSTASYFWHSHPNNCELKSI